MIFQIQTFLENQFHQRGLSDADQYAVSLAALYDRERHLRKAEQFLATMSRMRTSFYKRNKQASRVPFEKQILHLLDAKFKKKDSSSLQKKSPKELKLQASI